MKYACTLKVSSGRMAGWFQAGVGQKSSGSNFSWLDIAKVPYLGILGTPWKRHGFLLAAGAIRGKNMLESTLPSVSKVSSRYHATLCLIYLKVPYNRGVPYLRPFPCLPSRALMYSLHPQSMTYLQYVPTQFTQPAGFCLRLKVPPCLRLQHVCRFAPSVP